MSDESSDPYVVYADREKGIKTRRIIEMVGGLHRLGYGRIRLACSWVDAGPAPVWFGDIAPVDYFRRDHGALLARTPPPEYDAMGSHFRCRWFRQPDYPWPGFLCAAPEQSAEIWLARYPRLATEGLGSDPEYTEWYEQMLFVTAPTGLIAAACYWEPPPDYMYVFCGPPGVERFPLPPPGKAADA